MCCLGILGQKVFDYNKQSIIPDHSKWQSLIDQSAFLIFPKIILPPTRKKPHISLKLYNFGFKRPN